MSKQAEGHSATSTLDATKLRGAIRRALKARRYYSARVADDIAFHMTDWLEDLSRFHALCRSPGRFAPRKIEDILMGFLVHVPNHVAAAAKLMVDVSVADIFEVGAVECGHKQSAGRRGTRSTNAFQRPVSNVTARAEKRKARAARPRRR